jgi:uncharacterized protein with NAD-binding domain and iron-sulfur cluster
MDSEIFNPHFSTDSDLGRSWRRIYEQFYFHRFSTSKWIHTKKVNNVYKEKLLNIINARKQVQHKITEAQIKAPNGKTTLKNLSQWTNSNTLLCRVEMVFHAQLPISECPQNNMKYIEICLLSSMDEFEIGRKTKWQSWD